MRRSIAQGVTMGGRYLPTRVRSGWHAIEANCPPMSPPAAPDTEKAAGTVTVGASGSSIQSRLSDPTADVYPRRSVGQLSAK